MMAFLLNTSKILHKMQHMTVRKGNIDDCSLLSPTKKTRMIISRLIAQITWPNLSNNGAINIKCKVTLQAI